MIKRGEVFKARFPHCAGTRGKKRPDLVVQADDYNRRLRTAVVAQFTTNLAEKADPACLLIEAGTTAFSAAGIEKDSLIVAYLLSFMTVDRLTERIGELPEATMLEFDKCLRAALGL